MSLRLVLLGPPGVGKGTQANLLSDKFRIPKISTGDILRKAIEDNSPLGQIAKKTIGQGKLVADDVVIGIIEERLKKEDCKKGFILDGFPRTVPQADALSQITSIDHVISIEVRSSEIVKRLEGRRTCKRCQKMFHLEFQPPKKEGICDDCQGELIHRKDDGRATIEKRLKEYQEQTAPLLEYYTENIRSIDGMGEIQEIFFRILKKIEGGNDHLKVYKRN